MTKAADDPSPEVKPFIEHLEDLRTTIIRCAAALVIGMIAAVPLLPRVMGLLQDPLKTLKPVPPLVNMRVTDAFSSAMSLSFWCGCILALPFLIFYIGGFVLPALTRSEQQLVKRLSGAAAILFIFGVWLGYEYTLPFAVQAMRQVSDWLGTTAQWTLESYLSFAIQLLLAFGIAFELPILILILGRLGLVSSRYLRSHRRHAIIVILIIGAILTPPDIVSQMIMSVPLYILFEACIWIIWAWERPKPAPPAVR